MLGRFLHRLAHLSGLNRGKSESHWSAERRLVVCMRCWCGRLEPMYTKIFGEFPYGSFQRSEPDDEDRSVVASIEYASNHPEE